MKMLKLKSHICIKDIKQDLEKLRNEEIYSFPNMAMKKNQILERIVRFYLAILRLIQNPKSYIMCFAFPEAMYLLKARGVM